MRRAQQQAPSPRDGIRKSRWGVIRNTQGQLKTTTMKTWMQWMPEADFGPINWAPPMTHRLRFNDVDAEVIFLAVDRPEDMRRLLSLELTGAWINEAREVPKELIDGVDQRIGRYPSKMDGGPTWHGMWMDTNAPDDDHWWPILAREVPPPEWMSDDELAVMFAASNIEFYTQPPALIERFDANGKLVGYDENREAENYENLVKGYYANMWPGKAKGFVDTYLLNRLGSTADGRPVYGEWQELMHLASSPLIYDDEQTVHVGIDFGLNPAAVAGQSIRGRVRVLREWVGINVGAEAFGTRLRQGLAESFPGARFAFWGDPAGDSRAQTNEETPFMVLRALGIPVVKAPVKGNDIEVRTGAVRGLLTRLVEGRPAFLLDPSCQQLRKGFRGHYRLRRIMAGGQGAAMMFHDTPEKNMASNVHDALQYCVIGMGEGRSQMRTVQARGASAPVLVRPEEWQVFSA